MENKIKILSRRDALKILGLGAGSALLAACAPRLFDTPTPESTAFPTMGPTMTPFQPDTPESPTNTPSPTEAPTQVPVPDRFKLGSFDPGATPHVVETTPGVMSTLGYVFPDRVLKYKVDKPHKLLAPYITDEVNAIFDTTATDNSRGNPGVSILTDSPNPNLKAVLELVHSEEPGAPGEIVRIITSWVIKNPGRKAEIIGGKIIITPDGQNPIEATIADVLFMDKDLYDDQTSEKRLWGVYPDNGDVMLFRMDKAGIADTVINDNTPGARYLVLASCVPDDGNYVTIGGIFNWAYAVNHNTAKRGLLVLRFISP